MAITIFAKLGAFLLSSKSYRAVAPSIFASRGSPRPLGLGLAFRSVVERRQFTVYLENNGTLETAQKIAAHESHCTTKLYDRTDDQLTLDEIEKISV